MTTMTANVFEEAARARHSDAEMAFRRRAMIARVLGHDPKPDEDALQAHHAAAVAVDKEFHVVLDPDDQAREGWRP